MKFLKAIKGSIYAYNNHIVQLHQTIKALSKEFANNLQRPYMNDLLQNLNKNLKKHVGKKWYVKKNEPAIIPMILYSDIEMFEIFVEKLKEYETLLTKYYVGKEGEGPEYEEMYKKFLGVEEYSKTSGCLGYIKLNNRSYEFVFKADGEVFRTKSFGVDEFSTWSSTDTYNIKEPGKFQDIIEKHYPEYFV
jgi:hypothetical protein